MNRLNEMLRELGMGLALRLQDIGDSFWQLCYKDSAREREDMESGLFDGLALDDADLDDNTRRLLRERLGENTLGTMTVIRGEQSLAFHFSDDEGGFHRFTLDLDGWHWLRSQVAFPPAERIEPQGLALPAPAEERRAP